MAEEAEEKRLAREQEDISNHNTKVIQLGGKNKEEDKQLEHKNESVNDENIKIINLSKDNFQVKDSDSDMDFSIDEEIPADKIIKEVESIEKSLLKDVSDSNKYSDELTNNKDLEDIHQDINEKNNDNTDFSFFEDAAV